MDGTGITLGVDVGGTKVLGVALGDADEVLGEQRVDTPHGDAAVFGAVELVVDRLLADVGGAAAVGVGIAGLVDRAGTLRLGPNLPGLVDVDVRARLSTHVGLPVRVENDATAATWAELLLGAGRGIDDLVVVTLGTGIGVGIVAGGRLVVGRSGFAGESGHMVVDPAGPLCPCGKRGCWERFASGSGLARLAVEAAEAGRLAETVRAAGGDPSAVRGEQVTAAAAAGDPGALEVFAELGRWVALGLANLTYTLDPQRILLAGGLSAAGDLLLGPVRGAFPDFLYGSQLRPPVEIELAALGERAGALGAALLARGTEPADRSVGTRRG